MKNGAESSDRRISLHGPWSSRMAFILAVAGSAVGLGNIWRFPYIAGQNGGGAFVLTYLVCVFAVGLPIMMSEILLGRRGRRNPITTMRILGEEEGSSPNWQIVGLMGVVSGFLILSFYSVIAGWALAYVFQSGLGAFVDASAEGVSDTFTGLTGSWPKSFAWHTAFMMMTVYVVACGVERGLERAVRVLMPSLLVLMVILLGYAMMSGHFMAGASFLLRADFTALTPGAVLVAMGQAFFTLSIGMGAVMAYGAYLPEGTSIANTSVAVVIADTLLALLAGLVIFPIVFANGLDTAQGPGLIFQTLPLAFGKMTGGMLFGTLFFVLLTFAAWTSAIGLLEPAVAWMVERHHFSRRAAAIVVGAGIWLLGLGTVLSFNVLSDASFLKGTPFDNLDYLTSNILLPLGGLLITFFAGWIMARGSSCEELDMGPGLAYKAWRFLARIIAPVAVVVVFIDAATGGVVTRLLTD